MITMKKQSKSNGFSCRVLFLGSVLLLCLLAVSTILTSCIAGSAEDNDGETAGTGIFAVDSAIRSYYGLTEEESLTVRMLEGVHSIRISATSYTYDREGYTLVDVTVNGNEQFGGVLENCMTEKRFLELYSACTDGDIELPVGKGGKSIIDLKKSLRAFYVDGSGMALADGSKAGTYVLSGDIMLREKNIIVYGLAEQGIIDGKFLEGNAVDLNKLSCLPKLEHLTLCGVEAEGIRDGLMLHREAFEAEKIDYES